MLGFRTIFFWNIMAICFALEGWGQDLKQVHACLKGKEVNWRTGPGYEHPVRWTYRCPGWPVIIRKKCWQWYLIEDCEGVKGWVHGHLLSFKQNILICRDQAALRRDPRADARVLAYLQKNVIGRFCSVQGDWYFVSVQPSYRGWVHKSFCWDPCHVP